MNTSINSFADYDQYWVFLASLVGVQAGIIGMLGHQPILIACSIFLFLFTSILISLDHGIQRIALHAFIWVELVAWFTYMFRT